MTKRVYFVDVARSFAIFLALFNHSMNDFNIWEDYSHTTYAILKIVTSSATPIFLFLFGMMLELVYFRRLRDRGLDSIKPRLIKRSIQCYIGFMLTSLAGYFGGLNDLKALVGTAIFATNNHYGNILKLYSMLIILVMFLLVFRLRFGIWKTFFLCLSYWIIYPFTRGIEFAHPNIGIFMSTLFGVGEGTSGPTVFNSLSIIALGMLCSYFITQKRDNSYFIKKCLIILVVLLVPIIYFVLITPFPELMENYLGNVYRRDTHPIYYLVSTALAIVNVILFAMLIPIGTQLKSVYENFLLFGRNSLSAFTLGNIILNLIFFQIQGVNWSIWASMIYIVFVYGLLYVYEAFEKRRSVVL